MSVRSVLLTSARMDPALSAADVAVMNDTALNELQSDHRGISSPPRCYGLVPCQTCPS
jgi:hypothetical protein